MQPRLVCLRHMVVLVLVPFLTGLSVVSSFAQSASSKDFKQLKKTSVTPDNYTLLPDSLIFNPFQSFQKVVSLIKSAKFVNERTEKEVAKRDLEFTILGDGSTVSGVTLDVSSKTSVKLTGRITTKKNVLTVDFEAAQKDSDVSLFSDGKYGGKFAGTANYHILLEHKYKQQPAAYPSFKPAFQGIVQSYNAAIDSATVLAYFMKHAFNSGVENTLAEPYVVKIELADSLLREHYPGKGIDDGAYFQQPGEYCPEELFMFALRLAKGYFPNTSFERVQDVYDLKKILGESADDGLKSALVNDYKKVLSSLAKRYSNFLASEIKLANAFWDAKFFSWLTISPNVSYQGYHLFGKGENGEVLKNESIAFWTPKVSFWFNRYWLFSDVAKLVRFGIEPILGNNLKDFKEVKYNERDTLQIESGGNVVLAEESTEGLFRNEDSKRRYKPYVNFYFEYYRLPKQDFKLGFVAKMSYMRDGILVKNRRKLRPEIGTVVNLLNKDKTKTLLTVQPYVRYDNLLSETKFENEIAVGKVKPREKVGVGILIGLPIRGRLAIGEE